MAVTARGLAKAAEILAGQFTLVATNVPYLGRGKQDEVLKIIVSVFIQMRKQTSQPASLNAALSFAQKRWQHSFGHAAKLAVSSDYSDFEKSLLNDELHGIL